MGQSGADGFDHRVEILRLLWNRALSDARILREGLDEAPSASAACVNIPILDLVADE